MWRLTCMRVRWRTSPEHTNMSLKPSDTPVKLNHWLFPTASHPQTPVSPEYDCPETLMDETRARSWRRGQAGHLPVREQWPHLPPVLHTHAKSFLGQLLKFPGEIWTLFWCYKCVCVRVCVSVRERWPRPPAPSHGGSLRRVTGPPLKRRLRNTHSAWDKINTRLWVGAP